MQQPAGLAMKNDYALLCEEDDDNDQDEESELACVGADLGGGFESTADLQAMTYKLNIKTAGKPK